MRLLLLKALIGFILPIIGIDLAHAGNVKCESGKLHGSILFSGEIQPGDYSRLVACERLIFVEEMSSLPTDLVISSPGGSVFEAMKIGEYVRRNKMRVVIPDTGECFSSCVYILAAGVIRWPWGDIGIHRPYFEAKPNQGYDTALKILFDKSRAYFRQMNIPESLADDMFSIPPQDMQLLGDSALGKYRLNQSDMAYEEEVANRNAAVYGLTRAEYMRRLKESERLSKECRDAMPKPVSTINVVRCGDIG